MRNLIKRPYLTGRGCVLGFLSSKMAGKGVSLAIVSTSCVERVGDNN